MRVRDLDTIDNYGAATRALGNRDERTIAHNTRLIRRGDSIAVRYHATDIVTYHADGRITLADGGYSTATTIKRLHAMTPAGVYVRREAIRDTYNGESYISGHVTAVRVPGDIERRIVGALTINV